MDAIECDAVYRTPNQQLSPHIDLMNVYIEGNRYLVIAAEVLVNGVVVTKINLYES